MRLAADFAPASRDQWLALVDNVLKGAPFSKLVTETYDGIEVQPLYTRTGERGEPGLPGAAPFVRGGRAAGSLGGWDVRARHADPDASATNAAILADLERGATSIWLRVGAGGVPAAQLDRALAGVLLDLAPVALDPGAEPAAAVDALDALWAARGVAPSAALGHFGLDPFHGIGSMSYAIATARRAAERYSAVGTLVASGAALHGHGAADVHELGGAVAMGVAYLRELSEAGLAIDAALDQIEFRLAATADQFATIAKLRAARKMWARVVAECGGTRPMRQHAVTSPVMLTRRDPWVNLLRTTVACFAAGAGGADSITVLPFDHAVGLPDAFARRLARNTHALLLDESNLARVIDPGGGSWYIEALTDEIAERAWAFFQRIEAAGGYGADSAAPIVEGEVAAIRARRERNVARRKDPLTGVSEFPDIGEAPLARNGLDEQPEFRLAAMFETLRDRADAAQARPRIFLANLGPIAVHSARATFAKNFFEVGGIEAVACDGAADEAELVARFRASSCQFAILCSSDKVYEARAEAAARALRDGGAVGVYLAGNPGDARDRYRAAGVDEFVFIGCDAAAILAIALDKMGVA